MSKSEINITVLDSMIKYGITSLDYCEPADNSKFFYNLNLMKIPFDVYKNSMLKICTVLVNNGKVYDDYGCAYLANFYYRDKLFLLDVMYKEHLEIGISITEKEEFPIFTIEEYADEIKNVVVDKMFVV